MSTVPRQGTHVMGVRFHPTDAELINYLKKFFKGQRFSSNDCPIEVADIYGDQPPWEIFGASQEKIRYFITPLKKRKSEYIRICDEQAAGDQVEDTTTLMQEEYHDLTGCNNGLQNELDSSYVATSVEKQDTTWSSATLEQEGAYGQILEQEQGQGADDIIIGSGEFREEMNEISEGIATDVPHDWWQQTSLLRDL
ncbi:hypothetical protein HAX54_019510 [Datura stramonium]|uniref:NAC domain-containing protein n=1 Tax=Datura stramonium TaxID=4076 RepID=A0ABS8S1V9_DATST|nr:hypothetical protein [Datura stramonium]